MAQRRLKLDSFTPEEVLRHVVSVTPAELAKREAADREERAKRVAERKKLLARRATSRSKRVNHAD